MSVVTMIHIVKEKTLTFIQWKNHGKMVLFLASFLRMDMVLKWPGARLILHSSITSKALYSWSYSLSLFFFFTNFLSLKAVQSQINSTSMICKNLPVKNFKATLICHFQTTLVNIERTQRFPVDCARERRILFLLFFPFFLFPVISFALWCGLPEKDTTRFQIF